MTDILAWLEAHETVLSATAAVVLVLSVSAAVMRSTLARGAVWCVGAVRARRAAWASKSEIDAAQPAGAAPEAKRTMLAILAADVTGYSRLISPLTKSALDACRCV